MTRKRSRNELAATHMEHICKTLGIAFDDFLAVAWYKVRGKTKKTKK